MENNLYIEIYAFSISIVFILFHKLLTDVDKQHKQQLFKNVLANIIVMFSLDLVWKLIESNYISINSSAAHEINYWVNALYFIFAVSSSFAWLVYSESVQGNDVIEKKSHFIISLIPLALMVILCIVSYKTKWLFSIDKNNLYQRGPLYFIQPIIASGYLIFTSIKAFIKSFSRNSHTDKKRLRLISSFVLLPLIALILQVITSLPLICIGMTVSLINVYINLQDDLISIDALTQINNRNQLYRYLFGLDKKSSDTEIYLLIMDVDKFKHINDTYGHIEGDKALKKIARALKLVAGKHNCFICRFGGDEFIVIYDGKNKASVNEVCKDIDDFIGSENENASYQLTVSIGCARYSEKIKNPEQLISIADSELYKVKAYKKSNR